MDYESVMKGGIFYLDISIRRGPKGLELGVKADPKLETFIKSLGSGIKEQVEAYGRSWYSLTPGKSLEVYPLENSLHADAYTLDAVTELFKSRDGRTNLSFLRIVGISEPEGIRFGMSGPFSKTYVREVLSDIGRETRNLIKDYVVPIHVNLRITSQEV